MIFFHENSFPVSLTKIVGNESLVREFAFTGEDFDANMAFRIGLVSKVVEGSGSEVELCLWFFFLSGLV